MISASPDPSCRFFLRGACTEGETRNPGREKEWACRRLDRLMLDFDAFLDRAEAFGLSEKEAARIWDARRHKAFEPGFVCPHPRPDLLGQRSSGELDCDYAHHLACLLLMPRCAGRCERYRAFAPR